MLRAIVFLLRHGFYCHLGKKGHWSWTEILHQLCVENIRDSVRFFLSNNRHIMYENIKMVTYKVNVATICLHLIMMTFMTRNAFCFTGPLGEPLVTCGFFTQSASLRSFDGYSWMEWRSCLINRCVDSGCHYTCTIILFTSETFHKCWIHLHEFHPWNLSWTSTDGFIIGNKGRLHPGPHADPAKSLVIHQWIID